MRTLFFAEHEGKCPGAVYLGLTLDGNLDVITEIFDKLACLQRRRFYDREYDMLPLQKEVVVEYILNVFASMLGLEKNKPVPGATHQVL